MPPSTLTPSLPGHIIPYLWMIAAIALEVAGTTSLVKSAQFTRPLPSIAMVLCYGLSFYCLSHALKTVPIGIAYALWGGVGMALTAVVGVVLFRQVMDTAALTGISLIIAGVVVLTAFSRSSLHG